MNTDPCSPCRVSGFLFAPPQQTPLSSSATLFVGVFSTSIEMRPSLQLPIAPGKRLAASFCLLAVLLIWAPAWAAALQSHHMDCCADGLCPAHGHHSKPSEPASHPAQSPMDCDHHDGSPKTSGLMPCSLACCHDSDHATTTATIFVLPAPTQIAKPAVALTPLLQPALTNFAYVSDPLSPPPRG